MSTTPGLIGRQANQVQLVFKNSPDISAWRVSACNTLDGAFAATVALFTVERGDVYRSASIRSKGIRLPDQSYRGVTMALIDPDDFEDPSNDIPGDKAVSYLRVEQRNAAGVWRSKGPIWLLPTADFFAVESPSITISGTAPAAALGATGLPPAGALRIKMPRPVGTVLLRNTGGANDLKIGFYEGQAMNDLPFGEKTEFFDSHDMEFFICVDHASNTTTFSAYIAFTNGIM